MAILASLPADVISGYFVPSTQEQNAVGHDILAGANDAEIMAVIEPQRSCRKPGDKEGCKSRVRNLNEEGKQHDRLTTHIANRPCRY
jgi:hypothetical protein